MSARIAVTGVLLVFILLLLVFMVEMAAPLSLFSDFNELCRIALIRMEVAGGITEDIKSELHDELSAYNFAGINIVGTKDAKYGDALRLYVEATIERQGMASLFQREHQTYTVTYDKRSVSRRIVK